MTCGPGLPVLGSSSISTVILELVYTSLWEPIVLLPPLASETVGGAGGGGRLAAPTPAPRTVGASPRSQRAQTPALGRTSQARSLPSRGRARNPRRMRTHVRKRRRPGGAAGGRTHALAQRDARLTQTRPRRPPAARRCEGGHVCSRALVRGGRELGPAGRGPQAKPALPTLTLRAARGPRGQLIRSRGASPCKERAKSAAGAEKG